MVCVEHRVIDWASVLFTEEFEVVIMIEFETEDAWVDGLNIDYERAWVAEQKQRLQREEMASSTSMLNWLETA